MQSTEYKIDDAQNKYKFLTIFTDYQAITSFTSYLEISHVSLFDCLDQILHVINQVQTKSILCIDFLKGNKAGIKFIPQVHC